MSLVRRTVDGLYKGVTKQEPTNRLEGQVEESINMQHSVEKGVSRRNPTEFIKSLASIPNDSFIHSYARGDGLEEYIIVIYDSNVRVFSTDGTEHTVTKDAQASLYLGVYPLNEVRYNNSFRALTIGDTTFIVNKRVICYMNELDLDGTVDEHLQNPFYWVKRSFDNGQSLGYDYTLDGSSTNATKTTTACANLASALGADYTAYGSVVVKGSKPVTFEWSDSYGSQASEGFWGTAKSVNDLPRTMSGAEKDYTFIVKIQGDPDNQYTTFWVKYEDDHWKETRKPAMANTIKSESMPVKLVRQFDGSFALDTIDYANREKGDEDTASLPSFIGNTIIDIFFFKNRLCFVSGENVIMSETAEYFNFFPTTVTDVLDSDPIDVAVDSNTVSILNHALPFNNSVVLLSNNAQFSLQADKVLSPNDVSISSTTSYDALQAVRPIALGNSIYFLSDNLSSTSLREYYVTDSGESNIAIDVSGHVKGYLPKSIRNMIGNTNEDVIFILPEDSSDTIYVYKFFNDGQERIQTAWAKWVFGGNITNITMIDDYLYLLIDRGSGNQLEKLDYSSSDYVGDYLDNGTIVYSSEVTLSETVLKDGEGKLIQSARSPLMYKTLQLTSTENSVYNVEIKDKIRTRIAQGYSVRDNKVSLQGKSSEVTVKIQSVDGSPLEFHTYAMELNYNMRGQLI